MGSLNQAQGEELLKFFLEHIFINVMLPMRRLELALCASTP